MVYSRIYDGLMHSIEVSIIHFYSGTIMFNACK